MVGSGPELLVYGSAIKDVASHGDEKVTKLKYFEIYTKRHCHFECSVEYIARQGSPDHLCPSLGRTQALYRKCGCRAAFFPRKMEENYKVCDFYQHAFCIAEEIINFDYDICTGKGFSGLFSSRF